MRTEVRKYLRDIGQAADLLATFTAGKRFEDYQADALLRAGTERQFEIIGEVLSQLARLDPGAAAGISEYRRLIAFRNVLIHGYADIDHRLIWDIVGTRLSRLRDEVVALLAEPEV